ncbi:MAG: protein translocase subunit SecF, partial [Deltaproteobacteria bacterium]
MQFIKPGVNINFVGNKNIAFILSMVMVVVSIFS